MWGAGNLYIFYHRITTRTFVHLIYIRLIDIPEQTHANMCRNTFVGCQKSLYILPYGNHTHNLKYFWHPLHDFLHMYKVPKIPIYSTIWYHTCIGCQTLYISDSLYIFPDTCISDTLSIFPTHVFLTPYITTYMTPYICSPTRVFKKNPLNIPLHMYLWHPICVLLHVYICSPTRVFLTPCEYSHTHVFVTPYVCSPTRMFLTPYLYMFSDTYIGWQKCLYILPHDTTHIFWHPTMRWLQLVGSLGLDISSAEYSLFNRALLQKRPIVLRSLIIIATQ